LKRSQIRDQSPDVLFAQCREAGHLRARHTAANRSEQIGVRVPLPQCRRRQGGTTIATLSAGTMARLADLCEEISTTRNRNRIIGEWIGLLRLPGNNYCRAGNAE